jgi:hypothetical protein
LPGSKAAGLRSGLLNALNQRRFFLIAEKREFQTIDLRLANLFATQAGCRRGTVYS